MNVRRTCERCRNALELSTTFRFFWHGLDFFCNPIDFFCTDVLLWSPATGYMEPADPQYAAAVGRTSAFAPILVMLGAAPAACDRDPVEAGPAVS